MKPHLSHDRLHIAILATTFGAALLGAASLNNGWPLFVVMPACGAAAVILSSFYARARITATTGAIAVLALVGMVVMLYFMR